MLPLLPREMLWTEKNHMDEFFELDTINEEFYEVFVTLREEPFGVQMDAVKIFNEVYYQITRMAFEHPLSDDLSKYISDIKANMGWNYSAELVMSMAYFMISLIGKNTRPFNRFFTKSINEKFFGCLYWKPFKRRFEKLKKSKRKMEYDFAPCPNPVDEFRGKYIRWSAITHRYDLSCIEHVINLWSDVSDQREIVCMIKDSMNPIFGENIQKTEIKQISRFIEKYLHETPEQENTFPINTRLAVINAQLSNQRQRLAELEAENARLKSLLDSNTKGKGRKFALVQIVDYCKERVEWKEAEMVVYMLNKLLRLEGTTEDYELVDSIEEEFKRRRQFDIDLRTDRTEINVLSPGNIVGHEINKV